MAVFSGTKPSVQYILPDCGLCHALLKKSIFFAAILPCPAPEPPV